MWDHRRRVADLFAEVGTLPPGEGWRWRRGRDELFRAHPQSPIGLPPRHGAPLSPPDNTLTRAVTAWERLPS